MPTLLEEKEVIRWRLKSCRHCGGDLHLEEGEYEKVLKCFQCGRVVETVRKFKYKTGRRDKWE